MSAAPTRTRRYTPDALLVAMRAAMDDPATVVGVTTSLAALDGDPTDGLAGQSTAAALRTLSNLRGLLARNNQRRLGLSLDVKPGFTLWRRDVVVDAGGFSTDVESGTARDDGSRASAPAARASAVPDPARRRAGRVAASGAHARRS